MSGVISVTAYYNIDDGLVHLYDSEEAYSEALEVAPLCQTALVHISFHDRRRLSRRLREKGKPCSRCDAVDRGAA